MQNYSYENDFDLHENETACRTHFHMKGFALRLVLKQGHKRTRKWPITMTNSLVFFKNLIFTTLLQYIYSQKSRYCSDRELDNAIIHPATSLLIDYHYDCDNRIFVAIVISLLLVVKAWSTASLENPISTKVWTCKETRTKFMLNPFTKYHWFTVM